MMVTDIIPLDRLRDRPGALLGLDLGTKTIGVAACDVLRSLVAPVTVIRRTKFTQDAEFLLRLARERAVVGFVLGLPLNMDGSEGPRAQSVRAFARHFAQLADAPIAMFDERLSTVEAADVLTRAGVPARKQRDLIDAAAAMVILEDALKALTQS